MSGKHFLLAPGETLAAGRLGRRLAPLFEKQPLDLSLELRYGGGWIARDVDPELGARLEAALEDEGVVFLTVLADGPLERPRSESVRRVTFDGKTLEVDLSDSHREVPLEGLQLLDLLALGVPSDGTKPHDDVPAAAEYPFAGPRRALLDAGLDKVSPQLYLLQRAPVEFLVVEPGTHFPHYAEAMGGRWLDNFLTFLHHLLLRVVPHQVTPETRTFWEDAQLEGVLVHKSEERWNRLSWLAEITTHHLWDGAE